MLWSLFIKRSCVPFVVLSVFPAWHILSPHVNYISPCPLSCWVSCWVLPVLMSALDSIKWLIECYRASSLLGRLPLICLKFPHMPKKKTDPKAGWYRGQSFYSFRATADGLSLQVFLPIINADVLLQNGLKCQQIGEDREA